VTVHHITAYPYAFEYAILEGNDYVQVPGLTEYSEGDYLVIHEVCSAALKRKTGRKICKAILNVDTTYRPTFTRLQLGIDVHDETAVLEAAT
jgi:hypothetical protein